MIEETTPGALRTLVDPNSEVEQLAGDLSHPDGPAEGPLWWKEGGYLLLSAIGQNRRLRWTPGKGIAVDSEPTAQANGLTRDRLGRLVVCHHETRRVTRIESDGSATVVANNYRGLRLNRPNDVVVASDGSIYFTDPGTTSIESELDFAGVYRVSADLGTINAIARDFVVPNGLAFSPDEKVLYVNDSRRGHIRAFDVAPNGVLLLATDRVLCELRGERPGVPDGMKVDVRGNVYCTGPGGIWVISPAGKHLGTIATWERVTNLAWGDDDWQTLYFTTFSALGRVRMRVAGIPVPRGPLGA